MPKLRPSNSVQIETNQSLWARVISAKVISDWGDLRYIFYHSNIMKIISWD